MDSMSKLYYLERESSRRKNLLLSIGFVLISGITGFNTTQVLENDDDIEKLENQTVLSFQQEQHIFQPSQQSLNQVPSWLFDEKFPRQCLCVPVDDNKKGIRACSWPCDTNEAVGLCQKNHEGYKCG